MMPVRHFSVTEATELLPRLTELVGTLQQLRDAALVKRAKIDRLWQRLEGGEPVLTTIGEEQRALDGLAERLVTAVTEVEATGCILRDLDLGLIDFPFRASTGTVFLCWKVGESAIRFWHGPDEGFAARKPIAQLPLDRA